MFFDNFEGLLRVLVIAPLAYVAVVLVLRGAGKRSLAKLNAFDLVVTVALGSTLATVLLSSDIALAEGVLAFVVLALLQWIVSRASVAFGPFARAVRSRPRMLVENGRLLDDAMAQERVTSEEVEQAIRSQGIGCIEDVGALVLESDGSMSVIASGEAQEMTALASVRRREAQARDNSSSRKAATSSSETSRSR